MNETYKNWMLILSEKKMMLMMTMEKKEHVNKYEPTLLETSMGTGKAQRAKQLRLDEI